MRLIDRGYRLAYWGAFRLMRVAWFITRPSQHGALVMVWDGPKLLLIRNSYQARWSAPGGTIERGETAQEAALREMREEIGVDVDGSDLRRVSDITLDFRYRKDRVELFEWRPTSLPAVSIDNREVVEARWFTPDEARYLCLQPHIAHYLSAINSVTDPRPARGDDSNLQF